MFSDECVLYAFLFCESSGIGDLFALFSNGIHIPYHFLYASFLFFWCSYSLIHSSHRLNLIFSRPHLSSDGLNGLSAFSSRTASPATCLTEPHLLNLPLLLPTAAGGVDACGVNAAVSQNVREAHHVLVFLVVSNRE